MGRNTFYTSCQVDTEYDSDFEHVRLDLSPPEVLRIFAARDLVLKIEAENVEMGIEGLKIRSSAAFGALDLRAVSPPNAEDDEPSDAEQKLAAALNHSFLPERRGWAAAFEEHSTNADRILVTDYGVEWQAVCKYSGTRVWCEVGWQYFELFVLRRGLVEINSTSDAQAVAAGLLVSRDVSGLLILADALQEAGNPDWIPLRLRLLAGLTNEGEAETLFMDSLALKRLAAGQPKLKRKKIGDGKKKLG